MKNSEVILTIQWMRSDIIEALKKEVIKSLVRKMVFSNGRSQISSKIAHINLYKK